MRSYLLGVDLGQCFARTGIAVTERVLVPTGDVYATMVRDAGSVYSSTPRRETHQRMVAEYHVRHLECHGPPGFYSRIAKRVAELAERFAPAGLRIVVDLTSAGKPVYELLRREFRERGGSSTPRWTPVTITAGGGESRSPGAGYHVSRRDLVAAVQVMLSEERVRIAEGMALTNVLREEMASMKSKTTLAVPGVGDPRAPWREGAHDDLVLAVAMTVWAGERFHNTRAYRKIDVLRNLPA